MNHERREFLVVRGGRPNPSRHSPPPHTPMSRRMDEGSLPSGVGHASALSSSLISMEQRLSALLEDREQISRDLHDSVLQSLYAIGLSLEMAQKISPPLPPTAAQARTHAIEQLNRLIHEIRGTIHRLENGTIQTFNLAEELASLQHIYQQAGGLTITLELQTGAMDLLTLEEEQEILHIVREALSNSVRHAHATHIAIALKTRGKRIRLTIDDNGIGFDLSAQHRRGYGLTNMDARARKLGGALRIMSKPQGGTRLAVELFLAPLLAPV